MLEPAEIVKRFQKESENLKFSAAEVIFTEGLPGDRMFGIIEGEVDILVDNKVVETIKEGDVFGEGALIQQHHLRGSSAIAKTDCQLASIDLERFLFAVQETPMFALMLLKSYSDRLGRLKHKH